jgi:hypothetical protein
VADTRWGYAQSTTAEAQVTHNAATSEPGGTLTWTSIAVHSWQSTANRLGFNTNCQVDGSDNGSITYAGSLTIRMGGEVGGVRRFDGDIHEALIYGRALTVSEEHTISHYLAVKWACSTARAF